MFANARVDLSLCRQRTSASTNMSDKNKNEEFFRNTDTLVRRAWIESALEGVRARLGSGISTLEFGDAADVPAASVAERPSPVQSPGTPAVKSKPRLYVAWSAGIRRAGT